MTIDKEQSNNTEASTTEASTTEASTTATSFSPDHDDSESTNINKINFDDVFHDPDVTDADQLPPLPHHLSTTHQQPNGHSPESIHENTIQPQRIKSPILRWGMYSALLGYAGGVAIIALVSQGWLNINKSLLKAVADFLKSLGLV